MDYKVRIVSLLLAAAVLLLCFAMPQAVSAFQIDKGTIGIVPTFVLPTQPPKGTLFPGKPTKTPVADPGKPADPSKETPTPIKVTPRPDTRPTETLVIYPAPTGLNAEALLDDNIVRLSWDQVPGAQGYKVYRATAIDQDFTLVGPEEGDWSIPDEGQGNWCAFYDRLSMEPYTERFYKVSAVFSGGREGPQSGWAHVLALDPPPENLTAVALGPRMVLLSWSPSVGGADMYNITREGVDGEAGFWANGTVCIDGLDPDAWIPLQSDTEYRYRVNAVKNVIWQLRSDWVTVRTPLETPNYVTATPISASRIQITWDPVPGAAGYKVYHSDTGGDIYAYLGTSTTTVYDHIGLSADTFHAYKVVAYNDYGESAVSERDQTRTMLPPPMGVAAAAMGPDTVRIAWDPVPHAMGYIISRSFTPLGGFQQLPNPATGTSYDDTGLTPGTLYAYTVIAFNEYGQSGAQGSVTARTLLPAPGNLTAVSLGSGSIRLSWDPVLGATMGYNIYTSPTDDIYTFVAQTSGTTYSQTRLPAGSYHYYKVTAANEYGEGEEAGPVGARTLGK